MSELTPLLQQEQRRMDPDSEVEVWVCDANGLRYGMRMPISSTFNDVRRKLLQEDGNLQGIFEGSWDERKRTTVSQILQNPIPASFNDANHLYEHPIQAKFKKDSIWLWLWRWIIANIVALVALVFAIVSLIMSL